MADGDEFTRAKCPATGAIASLPAEALRLGHIPGWEAIDGPLPDGPKSAVFPPKPPPDPAGEPPTVTADSKSAKQTTKE